MRRGTLPALAGSALHLRSLDLNNAQEVDADKLFDCVFRNPNWQLHSLNLGHQLAVPPALAAALPSECVALRSLCELHLPFCVTATDATVAFFCAAASGGALRVLHLAACVRLSAAALESIGAACPRLELLQLTRCDAIDRVPDSLVHACRLLQSVTLPARCATGATLHLLRSLPSLRRVQLAVGARALVDQFSVVALEQFLLHSACVLVELHVCRIVHAQLASDVAELQLRLGTHRLLNLHDCAEHGGFVGSSRGVVGRGS